jgi:WD40 repeat protein
MARYGLVVGVAKYKSPLGNLSKTESDAKAVNDLLKQYGDFEDIQVLTGEVTAKQIEDALRRLLIERADRNEALIYFSGHAVVVKGSFGKKRGYFALSNTGLKNSSGEITGIENGIALDDLSGLIGEAKLSNLVVLLDCCHSETLLEESQGFLQRAIVNQAFAELKQDYFLVSACRKFEEAYAMKSESYSIFTGAMLRGLARDRADESGVVDTSSMFSYVAKQLQGTGQEAVSFSYGRALRIVDYRAVVAKSEVDETCPYVGLNAFDEKTAKWFFGRDEALNRLRQKLGQKAFVFVVGVSGSGKSSLVRAKLMPEWADRGYQIFVMKPRTSPLGQLKTVLTATLNDADQDQIEAIEDLLDSGDLLAAVELMPKKPILLVIDQFEEVFTLSRQKTEQRTFLKMLADVAQTTDLVDLAIVATMRVDFLGECTDATLNKIINEQMVILSKMNEDEFRDAIVKPAQVQGYELGEGLLDAILVDIENAPNCLPLLEFALEELWTHRDQQTRKLTYAAYRNVLKGIKGALNLHADRLYASQSQSKQKWMRRILLSLLEIGQDVKDTRQPKKREDLVAYGQDDSERKEIEAVLRALEGNAGRLLIAYEEKGKDEKEKGVAMVDLAHEALMDGWEEFKKWRMENRVIRRLADRVVKAWKEWIGKAKNEDYFLPNGLMLEVREQWEQIAPEFELVPMVKEYYLLSEQHSTDKIALIERNLTEIKLREEAMRVANSIPLQRTKEMLTAIQNAEESQEKLKIILNPVQANLQKAMLQMPLANIFQGHEDRVLSVAFSPDGKSIVSGSNDNTLRLWDLHGNQIGQPFQGHEDWVRSVAFSPDGRLIVSGSADKTLRLWDLQGNQIGLPFQGHEFSVSSVAFSPDGKEIVSGSADKTLRLWDLQGNQIGLPFQGHEQIVRSVAFSPDGKSIISGSDDKTLRLWDLQGNQIGFPFQGHEKTVRSVAFSPDGKVIVSGSADETLRLWDLQGSQIGLPFQHGRGVYSVSFSHDGKAIISGSDDNTLRLWDLQGNQIGLPFQGHEDIVNSVAFSSDGRLIVSGSKDKSLRLWDLQGNQIGQLFRGHDDSINSVAFSPDGKAIVLGGDYNNMLWLWDLQGNQIGQLFRGHDGSINSVAFSPDGMVIVSGSNDSTLRLWDLQGNQIGQLFQGHEYEIVRSVAFSPDGKAIVSGSGDIFRDCTLRLWDLQGNQIGLSFRGHEDSVNSVAFSPDGRLIVSGSKDNTLRLWDLQGNQIGLSFRGHEDSVNSVAFSPDGKSIVSGSNDNTLRLWDLQGNQIGLPFQGHEDSVNSVAFSPDGKSIISGSSDNTLRLWHSGWEAWLEVCCNRLRYHPVFKNPTDDLARSACEVCRKYVWDKEKVER